jgi:ankyrin repeat protein
VATLSLPTNPSLEQIRKQARDLQRKQRAAHADEAYPLHAAQRAIARGYGFASWPRLVHYFEVVDVYGRPGGGPRVAESAGVTDRFTYLACSNYSDDLPEYGETAGAILAEHPGLIAGDIWAATAAADVDAVRAILADDPRMANAVGGPYRWEPLCYLTYSRVDPTPNQDPVLTVARVLLDAGADPNAGYLWGGLPTPFTALTGVFGEGEQGAGRTPRHPYEAPLARLLLESGADSNDGQTLYNRMFRADNSHLELLFAYGLGQGDGGPWQQRLGADALDAPEVMLRRQLDYAVPKGFVERVRLLAEHGVDVTGPLSNGRVPVDVAAANGDRAMVDVLRAAGSRAPRLGRAKTRVAAILAGDRSAATDALAIRPDLVRYAYDAGRMDVVPLLVECGFDVDVRGRDGATALHWTAWNGDIEAARVLLAAGADPDLREPKYDATPLGWADFARQTAYAEMIKPLTKN